VRKFATENQIGKARWEKKITFWWKWEGDCERRRNKKSVKHRGRRSLSTSPAVQKHFGMSQESHLTPANCRFIVVGDLGGPSAGGQKQIHCSTARAT